MNEVLKGHQYTRPFSAIIKNFKWSFVIVEEQWQIILFLCERRKRGSERPEPSNPKRTKGSFRCMVSIVRSTHLPSFIRRTGCCTSLGFPGRRQLLLHTIEQAKRVCPFQGMLELHKNIVISLSTLRCEHMCHGVVLSVVFGGFASFSIGKISHQKHKG